MKNRSEPLSSRVVYIPVDERVCVCLFDDITITLTTGLFNFSSLSLQCHYIFTLFHTTEKEKGGGGHDAQFKW